MAPYESINAKTVERLEALSAKYGVTFVGSLALFVKGAYRNRALVVSERGSIFHYDKQYLFSPAGEHKIYKAGADSSTFSFNDWNIKLQVCYDLRFPESVSGDVQPDLIIYMANWPTTRIHHWKQLLLARAIENQSFVIGCNRVGIDQNGWEYPGASMAVNFDGNEMEVLPQHIPYEEVTLIKDDMLIYRKKLPFYQDKK